MIKPSTLCLATKDGQILLGMKKRGFGVGRWNGFGGKLNPGETVEEAAKRETKEEAMIDIVSMEKVGIHEFRFATNPEDVLEVHVFRIDQFSGTPGETEEMRPQWYTYSDIPYEEMWPDDQYWLPLFLAGKKFRTKFLFGEGDAVLEKEIEEVSSL